MKFGVFLPNGSNGYIPSAAAPVYLPTFEHNRAISVEAERFGLDFVLSMMKFRGFGGETGYWDACLESFTLMAGLAAATSKIELFPSAALLAHHPTMVARMVASIDDISNGRCGLNIVTGWNKPEYTPMGLWPGDDYYQRRYAYAADYVDIVKALWEEGRATHSSEFFTIEDCTVLPKPGRRIPIVCAGQSHAGVRFTAEHGDHNFVMAEPALLADIVQRVKAEATGFGRVVGTYALFGLIVAPSDAEAKAMGDAIVAGADHGAMANILASAGLDPSAGGTSERMKTGLSRDLETGNLAFMGFPVLHGSPETVARKIDEIAATTGIDGMLFSWTDFVGGIRDFGDRVMPLLRCR
ncbi:LLM class flavin-dependent oxidoreductase [Rhizorhabdus wittichii]|uniref:LLM class flavin-dependent oxidoreductase n=1 Tax=Rhizorhabdus wittichii TaxID=160791 RepID=A0A975CZF1_9SPHN|nr:LLM class flavin-dependent oxidoreductase [Rhizorhabdus wittichii]QTH20167.1 LLM class flavin-dependent oxidoreductase [Rhizorhabdus wittichii]